MSLLLLLRPARVEASVGLVSTSTLDSAPVVEKSTSASLTATSTLSSSAPKIVDWDVAEPWLIDAPWGGHPPVGLFSTSKLTTSAAAGAVFTARSTAAALSATAGLSTTAPTTTKAASVALTSSSLLGNTWFFSDDFNRTNASTLGSNWVVDAAASASPGILTNAVRGGTGTRRVRRTEALPLGTQFSQLTLLTSTLTAGGDTAAGPAVALSFSAGLDVTSGYVMRADASAIRIYKFASGGTSQIGLPGAYTPAASDVLRLEYDGTTLKGYVNGQLKVTVADSTYALSANPYVGFETSSGFTTTQVADDWSGGLVGASAPIAPVVQRFYSVAAPLVSTSTLNQIGLFSDDFNRADGSLGSNWISNASGTALPSIVSGGVRPGNSNVLTRWATAVPQGIQFAQLTVLNTAGVGGRPSLIVGAPAFASNSGFSGVDYILFEFSTTDLFLNVYGPVGNGAGSQLAYVVQVGDVIRLEWDGVQARAYVNGTQKLSYTTPAAYPTMSTNAYVGFRTNTSSVTTPIFDNWSGGGGGGTAPTAPVVEKPASIALSATSVLSSTVTPSTQITALSGSGLLTITQAPAFGVNFVPGGGKFTSSTEINNWQPYTFNGLYALSTKGWDNTGADAPYGSMIFGTPVTGPGFLGLIETPPPGTWTMRARVLTNGETPPVQLAVVNAENGSPYTTSSFTSTGDEWVDLTLTYTSSAFDDPIWGFRVVDDSPSDQSVYIDSVEIIAISPQFSGSGTLAASGVRTLLTVVGLVSTSALAITAPDRTQPAQATLVSGSALSVQPTLVRVSGVLMTATSTLVVQAIPERAVGVPLAAVSALLIQATPERASAISMSAASALAVASLTLERPAAVVLVAASTLTTAAPTVEQATSVPFAASSTLTASAPTIFAVIPVEALLSATSALTTAAPTRIQPSAVPLASTSTLTPTASAIGEVAATSALVSSSTLTTTAPTRVQPAAVLLTVESTLQALAIREQSVAASLVGSSALVAQVLQTRTASILLSTYSTLVAVATPLLATSVALFLSSTLTTAATPQLTTSVSLTASSTLASIVVVGRASDSALTSSSTLSVEAPTRTQPSQLTLISSSVLSTSAPVRVQPATVGLVSSSTLTTAAFREKFATVPLVSSSTLTSVTTEGRFASVPLSGSGTLSSTAVPTTAQTTSLSGSGSLAAVPSGLTAVSAAALSGDGSLVVATTLQAARSVVLSGSGTLTTVQLPKPAQAVVLAGDGSLSVSLVVRPAVSVALEGSGDLAVLRLYLSTITAWATTASGTGWADTVNATGPDDNTFATWTSSTSQAVSPPLVLGGFGSWDALPEDAVVQKVTVRVKGYSSHA